MVLTISFTPVKIGFDPNPKFHKLRIDHKNTSKSG